MVLDILEPLKIQFQAKDLYWSETLDFKELWIQFCCLNDFLKKIVLAEISISSYFEGIVPDLEIQNL